MLPVVTGLQLFAALPHGASGVAVMDTRVVRKESEGTSSDIRLDMRVISSMLACGESPAVGLDSGGGAGVPVVTGLSPEVVPAVDGRQWVTVRGRNFAENAVVTLRVDGGVYVIPAERTLWVSFSEIRIYINVTAEEADWTAQVTNPGFQSSALLSFAVGFPDITPAGAVDFGVVAPGGSVERSFVVRNRGASAAALSVSVSAPFAVVNGPFAALAGGGEQVVEVRYAPAGVGSDSRMVVFGLGTRSMGRVVSGRSAAAVVGMGGVEGTVTVTGGGVLANAAVEVNRIEGTASLRTGVSSTTDARGRFRLSGLAAGHYEIRASPPAKYRSNYENDVVTVDVSAGLTASAFLTLPVGDNPRVVDHKEIPVVLVRGRGKYNKGEYEYWQYIRERLIADGFKYVWDPYIDAGGAFRINGEKGIGFNAEKLKAFIEYQMQGSDMDEFYAQHGFRANEVNIVAHSMGGLITREYLQRFRSAIFKSGTLPLVNDVIMLGTPHAGSLLADVSVGIFDHFGGAWESDRALHTMHMRAWSRRWPVGQDVKLYQVGGTAGNADLSSLLYVGWTYLRGHSPPGDRISDGAVTTLSSRGQYMEDQGLFSGAAMFAGFPSSLKQYSLKSCFSPPGNEIGHQLRSVNHSGLLNDLPIAVWLADILGGGTPKPLSYFGGAPAAVLSVDLQGSDDSGEVGLSETEIVADDLSYYDSGELSATQSITAVVNIDPTEKAQFMVSGSSTSLWVTLESPAGVGYDITNSVGFSNVTFAVSDDTKSAFLVVTLDNPEAGEWRVELGADENAEFRIYMSVASEIELMVSEAGAVAVGADMPLLAAAVSGGTNLPITAAVAELVSESGVATNVVLYDDGSHNDYNAGDDIYGRLLATAGFSGDYQLIYRVEGAHPSGTGRYERVEIKSLTMGDSDGFIVGVDGYEAIDTDDNGLADFVRVDVRVSISTTGEYSVVGDMVVGDSDVRISSESDFSLSSNGTAVVSLLFDAHDLPQGEFFCGFMLGEIRLSRVTDQQMQWLNTFNSGESVGVSMYNQISRSIRLSGAFDFGGVRIGTQKVSRISLHNYGWERVTVGGINLPQGFTGDFSGDIRPGEEVEVPVVFTPVAETSYTGRFEIVSDAAVGDFAMDISGLGLPEAVLYDQWATNSSLPTGMSSPTNILNSDGIPNYLAYIYNIDPVTGIAPGDTNALPFWHLGQTNRSVMLDYRLNATAVDFSFDVETSTNLMDSLWQIVAPEDIEALELDPLTGDPRFRIKKDLADSPSWFMRYKVEFYGEGGGE